MGPIQRSLLPLTADVSPGGHLFVGGCDLVELAEEFGTPLFVYDEDELRTRCREAVAVFGAGVAYATKAFLCRAMARLAAEEGLSLDVATGGELHAVLDAGVPPERVVLHGNNKSADELTAAITAGVGRIVVDSFDELDRLDHLLAETPGRPAPVMLRVTPGVEAHTHEFVRTGQDDSKFGFGLASGAAARAIDRVRATPGLSFLGIHTHIGSQIFRPESFIEALEVLGDFVRGLQLDELCVGGGLGVAYVAGESAPSISEWAEAVHRACRAVGIPETTKVTAEPGRSIVAKAGITVYRVGTIKDLPGIRTYVSVDGGMSDNPRPVLYGSGYEAFDPDNAAAPRPRRVTVVGKHCESGDVLVRDAHMPETLRVGALLATPVTGAYGYSMASNYNKVPRPAVVFVSAGRSRLVVRRETNDDLLRLDQ